MWGVKHPLPVLPEGTASDGWGWYATPFLSLGTCSPLFEIGLSSHLLWWRCFCV